MIVMVALAPAADLGPWWWIPFYRRAWPVLAAPLDPGQPPLRSKRCEVFTASGMWHVQRVGPLRSTGGYQAARL